MLAFVGASANNPVSTSARFAVIVADRFDPDSVVHSLPMICANCASVSDCAIICSASRSNTSAYLNVRPSASRACAMLPFAPEVCRIENED